MADTLRVYANPFTFIAPDGQPHGVVMCDPVEHTSHEDRRWVGAHLDPTTCKGTLRKGGDLRSPESDHGFTFSEDAVTLPQTQYYLDRIREGSLIAGDAATAAKAGVKFEDPAAVLDRAADEAIAEYVRHYGKKPAFAAQDGDK